LREFATAKVLTSPMLRRWATNTNPSDPGALQLILSSAPFVESLTRNFGPGREAQNAAQSLKSGMDDWLKRSAQGQATGQAPAGQAPAEPAAAMPTLEEFRQAVQQQNRR